MISLGTTVFVAGGIAILGVTLLVAGRILIGLGMTVFAAG